MAKYVRILTDRLIIINNNHNSNNNNSNNSNNSNNNDNDNSSYVRIPPLRPSMLVYVGALTDRLIIINEYNSHIRIPP